MPQSEISVTDQLINKLGLQNEERLKEKTTELLRLLEVKTSRTGSTINDCAKTIICIDLATSQLGIPFDAEIGLKLAALRKTAYENHKRIYEKLLDLNKPIEINEICMQLGLHENQKKASQFLDVYRKHISESADEIDVSHPQYAAMAVYQACKSTKGSKSIRSKLIVYSHLKPAQWTKLEQQWDKLLESYGQKGAKSKKTVEAQSPGNRNKGKEEKLEKVTTKPTKVATEIEDYEVWKKRMLDFAYAKLKGMVQDC